MNDGAVSTHRALHEQRREAAGMQPTTGAVCVVGFGEEFQAALTELMTRSGPNVLVVQASLPPVTSSTRWYRR